MLKITYLSNYYFTPYKRKLHVDNMNKLTNEFNNNSSKTLKAAASK